MTLDQLKPWVELHGRLVKNPPHIRQDSDEGKEFRQGELQYGESPDDQIAFVQEMNNLVYNVLGLDKCDRALVRDLVKVRLELNEGKIGDPAVRQPKSEELKAYAQRLKSELDGFIEDELDKWHQIGIVYDKASASGMVQVDLIADKAAARELLVVSADKPTAKQLEQTRQRLRKKRSQWVYFDRNLRIYEGTKTFIFKPLQRFHWTESQAMSDASEIVAETLQLGEESP